VFHSQPSLGSLLQSANAASQVPSEQTPFAHNGEPNGFDSHWFWQKPQLFSSLAKS
jgi:hypothetical protein